MMDIVQLNKKLIDADVQKSSYSLNGGLPNEAYCLAKENNLWEVYYSEHGIKSDLKIFTSETEACKYLYEILTE